VAPTHIARHRQRGSVTAEFAVALPVFVLTLAFCLGAVAAATAKLRCVDAARAGARAVARGESVASAVAAARAAAPAGARVRVQRLGSDIRVEVQGRVSLLGAPGMRQITLGVGAAEQAPLESGVVVAGPG
jgi:Flp pilus assembly protein TadG